MNDYSNEQQQDAPGDDAPAPAPLPDNLDVGELMGIHAQQSATPSINHDAPLADEETPDDDEAGDDEGAEDEGNADDDGSDAANESKPPPTPEAAIESVRNAGERIAGDPEKVQGILHALPRAQRGPAVAEAIRLAYVRGAHDMFANQQGRATEESELREFVRERTAARDENPDEFLMWEDKHPDEAARFASGRVFIKDRADGKPVPLPGGRAVPPADADDGKPKLTESQQTIQALANREGQRLAALPQTVQDAISAQGFALTVDGIEAFRQAISDAEAAARRGTTAPDAAARRMEADRLRRGTARVDPGQRGSSAPPKKNPIADVNDVDALMDMALVGAVERRRG